MKVRATLCDGGQSLLKLILLLLRSAQDIPGLVLGKMSCYTVIGKYVCSLMQAVKPQMVPTNQQIYTKVICCWFVIAFIFCICIRIEMKCLVIMCNYVL